MAFVTSPNVIAIQLHCYTQAVMRTRRTTDANTGVLTVTSASVKSHELINIRYAIR